MKRVFFYALHGYNHDKNTACKLVRKTKETKAKPSGWAPGKKVLTSGQNPAGDVWKDWSTDMAFD